MLFPKNVIKEFLGTTLSKGALSFVYCGTGDPESYSITGVTPEQVEYYFEGTDYSGTISRRTNYVVDKVVLRRKVLRKGILEIFISSITEPDSD